MSGTTPGGIFRFPYDIETTLEPWREQLGDAFDAVVAFLADRDRALEDAVGYHHTHDGEGDDSIVVSGDTQDNPPIATGISSVAIGENAFAQGDSSVAVGDSALAQADSAVAVGDSALASEANSIAIGTNAAAQAALSIAVGFAANTTGGSAVAVGDGAAAQATNAVALGAEAYADSVDAVALGPNSRAEFSDSVALGADTETTNTSQVNLGTRQAILGGPSAAPNDSFLIAGQIAPYLDETNDLLKIKAKESGGTIHTFVVGTSAPVTDHDDLTNVTADQHHDQAHAVDGADHTASGLTTRHVLRATGATTFAFGAIEDADLPSTIARDSEVTTAVSDHNADTTSVHGITDTSALALTADVVTKALLDAKGDLIAGTAADTPARVAVGTDGQVLTADSGEATGVKWADASGGGGSGDGLVPYFIPADETYTVPEYRQALFVEPIDVEGVLDVEGLLIEVTQAPDLSALLHMQLGI